MSETNRIEHKRELTKDLDIEKEVIAFLNYHEGGILYIGIDKDGSVTGVEDVDSDILKIKDRLKNNIQPSCLGLFDVKTEKRGEKYLIKVIIASGPEKPYYKRKYGMTEKGSFIRVGTASEPMTHKMIEELFAKRTRNSLGKIVSRKQDLRFEQLRIFYEEAGYSLNENFAANLELLTNSNKYNYIAYLLSDINSTSIKVEITSAGGLPEGLNQEEFFRGFSVPRNKELMRIFKDPGMVEQLGSGVPRILESYGSECFSFSDHFLRMSLPVHESITPHVTPHVTPQVEKLILIIGGEMTRQELQDRLNLSDRMNFLKTYLQPAIESGVLEMTISDKPKSRDQRYRLTNAGKELKKDL